MVDFIVQIGTWNDQAHARLYFTHSGWLCVAILSVSPVVGLFNLIAACMGFRFDSPLLSWKCGLFWPSLVAGAAYALLQIIISTRWCFLTRHLVQWFHFVVWPTLFLSTTFFCAHCFHISIFLQADRALSNATMDEPSLCVDELVAFDAESQDKYAYFRANLCMSFLYDLFMIAMAIVMLKKDCHIN